MWQIFERYLTFQEHNDIVVSCSQASMITGTYLQDSRSALERDRGASGDHPSSVPSFGRSSPGRANPQVGWVQTLYLDGGFATLKTIPKDFDGCWESVGVDLQELARIEPALVTFDPNRSTQKLKFGGELFIAEFMADTGAGRTSNFFKRTEMEMRRESF